MQASVNLNTNLSSHSKKMTFLEAARGVASIVVVFHHFCLAFLPWVKMPYPEGIANTPVAFVMRGESAVIFFFVLSGFVLVRGFYVNPNYAILLSSALKRLPRLMGPASISIMAGFIILSFHLNFNEQAAAVTNSRWLREFGLANLPPNFSPSFISAIKECLLVFIFPGHASYNTNLWTMRPEFLGSLIVLALCAITMRKYSLIARHIVILLVGVLIWIFHYASLPFIAGAYLAFIFVSTRPRMISRPWFAIAGIVLSLVMLCSIEQTWQISGSIILMICLLCCPAITRPLSGRLGVWLGKLSFPLYLVHTLIILSASSYGFSAVFDATGSYYLSAGIAGLITAGLSLAAALPLMYFDEWWVAKWNSISRRGISAIVKSPSPSDLALTERLHQS